MAKTPSIIRLYMCPLCGEWDRYRGVCDNRKAHSGRPPALEPITVHVQHKKAGEDEEVGKPTATVEDRDADRP